jgi:hypothetical protein
VPDLHIDDFYLDAGRVLLQLYQTFPRKTAIYVEDISGPDEPDEYGLHSKRYLACLSAMIWLAEQGYLSYESCIRQEAIDQAALSHKGFTLLSSRCELDRDQNGAQRVATSTMEQSRSNIAHLRRAIKSRSSATVEQTMQYLLGNAHRFQ